MGNRYPLTFPQAPLPLGKIEEPRPPEMSGRFAFHPTPNHEAPPRKRAVTNA